MFKLLEKIPKDIIIAISGGVDSVAVTDFLSRRHNVSCAFFHHGTENSDRAFSFVEKFCSDRNLALFVGMSNLPKPKKTSLEEHWRNCRYNFLESLSGVIVTAHNLDDCIETYLYSSLHGVPKVIPYSRNNIIRPFLTTPKRNFIDWCQRKNIEWCEDFSNDDIRYMRNYIRHQLMPHALHVNPGLATVVKKIIEKNHLVELLKKNS